MKQLTLVIVALLLVSGIVFPQAKKQSVGKQSATKVETTVVNVPTIVCNSCVNTITKALKKVSGVKATRIDLKEKKATVSYVSSKVSVEKIEKAISDAGYDANNVKRDPSAYAKLDACCKIDSKK